MPKFLNGIFLFIWHIPRNLAIYGMKAYQRILSPDHSFWGKAVFPGGLCKYTPSCSEYMVLSLKKHGFIKGGLKGWWRVCRCNPWLEGGLDLP
jgi:hypothetical protein